MVREEQADDDRDEKHSAPSLWIPIAMLSSSCRSANDQQQSIANHDKAQSHEKSGDDCAVKRRQWLIEYCHPS